MYAHFEALMGGCYFRPVVEFVGWCNISYALHQPYSDGQTLRNGFGIFFWHQVLFSFLSAVPSRYLSFLSVDPDCYGPIQHLELFSILRNIFQHLETFSSTSPTAIHDRSCVSRLV